jgi:hypothetical protein
MGTFHRAGLTIPAVRRAQDVYDFFKCTNSYGQEKFTWAAIVKFLLYVGLLVDSLLRPEVFLPFDPPRGAIRSLTICLTSETMTGKLDIASDSLEVENKTRVSY